MRAEEVERLRLVLAPVPYSALWPLLAALVLALVAGWVAGVVLWTTPVERLRRVPVLRETALRLLKRRYSRAIDSAAERHRQGQLSSRAAHGEISRALRQFLQVWTSEPASRMVLAEFAERGLAGAAGAIEVLYSGQFAPQEQPDVLSAARAAKGVLAAWQ